MTITKHSFGMENNSLKKKKIKKNIYLLKRGALMKKKIIMLFIITIIFSCNISIKTEEEKEIIQNEVKEATSDINSQIKNNDIDLFFYNQSSYTMDYIFSSQSANRSADNLNEGSYSDDFISYNVFRNDENSKSVLINNINTENSSTRSISYDDFYNKNNNPTDKLYNFPLGIINDELDYSTTPPRIIKTAVLKAREYLSKVPAFIAYFDRAKDSSGNYLPGDSFVYAIDDYRVNDDANKSEIPLGNYVYYKSVVKVYDSTSNTVKHTIYPTQLDIKESQVVARYNAGNGNIGVVRKKTIYYLVSLDNLQNSIINSDYIRLFSCYGNEQYMIQPIVPAYIKGVSSYGRAISLQNYDSTRSINGNNISKNTTVENIIAKKNIVHKNIGIINDIIKNDSYKPENRTFGQNKNDYIRKMSPIIVSWSESGAFKANTEVRIEWDVITYNLDGFTNKMGVALTVLNGDYTTSNVDNLQYSDANKIKEQMVTFVEGKEKSESSGGFVINFSDGSVKTSVVKTYEAILKIPNIDARYRNNGKVYLRFFTREMNDSGSWNPTEWRGVILSNNITNTANSYQIELTYEDSSSFYLDIPLPANFWNWCVTQSPGSSKSHNNNIFSPYSGLHYDYWSLDFGYNSNNWYKLDSVNDSYWYNILSAYSNANPIIAGDPFVDNIPILSSARGNVKYRNHSEDEVDGSYGRIVLIEHKNNEDNFTNGYATFYCHLASEVSPTNVVKNSDVEKGVFLSFMGNTGNMPKHLHWGISFNDYSIYKDETLYRFYNNYEQNIGAASALIRAGIVNEEKINSFINYKNNFLTVNQYDYLQSLNGTVIGRQIENLTVTNNLYTGIQISWDKVIGATSYHIERSVNNIDFKLIKSTTLLTYTDTSCGMNRDYYYRVRAETNKRYTNYSNSIGGIKLGNDIPIVVGENNCTIQAGDRKWYYFREEAGYFYTIAFKDKYDPASGDSYTADIKMSAYKESKLFGEEYFSGKDSGWTSPYKYKSSLISGESKNIYLLVEESSIEQSSGTFQIIITKTDRPDPPEGVSTFSYEDALYIDLTWEPSIGADKYYIYRSLNNINYVKIGEPSGESYRDDKMGSNRYYYYKVSAVTNDGKESALSPPSESEMSIESAEPISVFNNSYSNFLSKEDIQWFYFEGKKNGGYTIEWDESYGCGIIVSIYRNDKTTGYFTNIDSSPQSIIAIENENIYIKVEGKDLLQTGNYNVKITGEKPAKPASVQCDFGDYYNQIEISWSSVSGAVGYSLSRSSDGSSFKNVNNNILTTSYLDNELYIPENGNITYKYYIEAFNDFGTSNESYSNELTLTDSIVRGKSETIEP